MILLFRLAIFFFHFLLASELYAAVSPSTETVLPPVKVIGKRKTTQIESTEMTGEAIDISARPETNLAQILERSPSLLVRPSLGEGASPSFLIRGQDSIQNRFFIEGIPLTDAQFNLADIGQIPLESLRTAEVFAEGVPASYGADGLGGAINFTLVGPEERSKAFGIGLRAGSYQFGRVFARLGTKAPDLEIAADVRTSSEDFRYFDDGGTPNAVENHRWRVREHNRFRRLVLFPKANLLSKARSRTQVSAFNFTSLGDTEIPGAINFPIEGELRQLNSLTAVKAKTRIGDTSDWHAHLYVRFRGESLASQNEYSQLIPQRSQNWASGIQTQLKWPGLETSAGARWDRYSLELSENADDRREKRRFEIPLSVGAKIPVIARRDEEPYVLRPALLAHFFSYTGAGGNAHGTDALQGTSTRNYFLASPRLGFTAQPVESIRGRASAGYFYRAPSMFEMYGAPSGLIANLELSPERAEKADAGIDLIWNRPVDGVQRVKFSYTYFYTRTHDLIAYLQNSQQTRIATNIGESVFYGHELSLEFNVLRRLVWNHSAQFLFSENRSDISYQRGKEIPNRAPYRYQSNLTGRFGDFGAGYSFSLIGPTYWDLANTKQLDALTEHGAWLSWETASLGTFLLEGQNLGDSVTATSNYDSVKLVDNTTGFPGFPAPGRRIYLSWKIEI